MHIGKYLTVLRWIEQSELPILFDEFKGTLCGGNFICRRSAFIEVGGFSTLGGRSVNNLMGGADDELHRSLKALGKNGLYDPALIIFQYIPVSRMTRKYHSRWAFWSGTSNGIRLHWLPSEPGAKILGIPRFRFAQALVGLKKFLRYLLQNSRTSGSRSFPGLFDFICV